jgi:hypothetical protein
MVQQKYVDDDHINQMSGRNTSVIWAISRIAVKASERMTEIFEHEKVQYDAGADMPGLPGELAHLTELNRFVTMEKIMPCVWDSDCEGDKPRRCSE